MIRNILGWLILFFASVLARHWGLSFWEFLAVELLVIAAVAVMDAG